MALQPIRVIKPAEQSDDGGSAWGAILGAVAVAAAVIATAYTGGAAAPTIGAAGEVATAAGTAAAAAETAAAIEAVGTGVGAGLTSGAGTVGTAGTLGVAGTTGAMGSGLTTAGTGGLGYVASPLAVDTAVGAGLTAPTVGSFGGLGLKDVASGALQGQSYGGMIGGVIDPAKRSQGGAELGVPYGTNDNAINRRISAKIQQPSDSISSTLVGSLKALSSQPPDIQQQYGPTLLAAYAQHTKKGVA